jgi:hypothetical protein
MVEDKIYYFSSGLKTFLVENACFTSGYLYNLFAYTSNRHTCPNRQSTMGFFTVPKTKIDLMCRSVMYRAMSSLNALTPEFTQAKSKFSFKKQI